MNDISIHYYKPLILIFKYTKAFIFTAVYFVEVQRKRPLTCAVFPNPYQWMDWSLFWISRVFRLQIPFQSSRKDTIGTAKDLVGESPVKGKEVRTSVGRLQAAVGVWHPWKKRKEGWLEEPQSAGQLCGSLTRLGSWGALEQRWSVKHPTLGKNGCAPGPHPSLGWVTGQGGHGLRHQATPPAARYTPQPQIPSRRKICAAYHGGHTSYLTCHISLPVFVRVINYVSYFPN